MAGRCLCLRLRCCLCHIGRRLRGVRRGCRGDWVSADAECLYCLWLAWIRGHRCVVPGGLSVAVVVGAVQNRRGKLFKRRLN